MDDLISRQAAIDAIERLILPQVKGETAAEEINRVAWRCAINCAEEMIGHLPSAERHGRWIPVTERLPEAYGRYLVTLEDEDYISVMPLYYGRINRIDTFYDSDSEYGDIEYCGVIAWMPLPTPYKGGEEE